MVEPAIHQAPVVLIDHADDESPSYAERNSYLNDQTGRSTSQKKLVKERRSYVYGQKKLDEEYEGGVDDQDNEGNQSYEYDEHVDPNKYRIPQNIQTYAQKNAPSRP